ncbi:MAG: NUDIX domain-containing protein [Oscillospiraceae bacterium]|nr:NUDIX domain-containing protein [Oscillospiraceae bacterium]
MFGLRIQTANGLFQSVLRTSISRICGRQRAALREAKEELGIELCPENGYLFKTAIRQYRNFPDFLDIWVFNQDFPIESVVLQAGETCGAKWASSEEILEMKKNGEFIPMNVYPYLKELFEN